MLLSAVSVLVVAQSSSEIPEGLMNNPVEGVPSTTPEPSFISLELVVAYKNVSEYDKISVARIEIGATV